MQRRQNLIEEKIKFYNRIEKISNLYNIRKIKSIKFYKINIY